MSRRRSVGLLLDHIGDEYELEIRVAVERAARRRGINLLFVAGERLEAPNVIDAGQNRIYQLIGPQTVDGILLVSSVIGNYVGPAGVRRFCEAYAPLPVCSIGFEIPGVPSVIVDNAGGMESAVLHVLDIHARRHVAYISGPSSSDEANARLDAYRRALAARAIPYDERLVVFGDFRVPGGVEAARELLRRRVHFDALVAANDNMALAAADVLSAAGMAVPEQIIVTGFDDAGVARVTSPSSRASRCPSSSCCANRAAAATDSPAPGRRRWPRRRSGRPSARVAAPRFRSCSLTPSSCRPRRSADGRKTCSRRSTRSSPAPTGASCARSRRCSGPQSARARRSTNSSA